MPLPPLTSRVPQPGAIFMPAISYQVEAPPSSSSSAARAEATPLPMRYREATRSSSSYETGQSADQSTNQDGTAPSSSTSKTFPLPKLRLEIRDLSHPGSQIFLAAINASSTFSACVHDVLKHLYTSPSNPATHVPPTRSVTLILRDMGGVAYTTGSDLDSDHKEIHFNLGYISKLPQERHTDEITGVLTHELVHCFQYNGRGAAPGGLIEGIADWVRLRCDLAPPHWKREAKGNWDGGYQHTAYFLAYLAERFGADTVRRLNEGLRVGRYEEKAFWTGLLGRPVEQLWEDYRENMAKEGVNVEEKKGESEEDKVDEATQT
ncbi:peptidase of plants and bacteria-domain-containing protein [Xylariales sp. AK1849]|nr:peptidase of plants and bacteria-domain-containing protein [Xylariales sp. AK1849]